MMKKFKEQRRDLRYPNQYPVKMVVDTRMAYQGVTQDQAERRVYRHPGPVSSRPETGAGL